MTLELNPHVRRLVCSRSGADVPDGGFSAPLGLCRCCPAPGSPVLVEYDPQAVRADLEAGAAAALRGIWRFAALLPVRGVDRAYADDVGDTALVERPRLGAELGVELHLKCEGTNPSGSFKDRGLAVAVALGRALGAERFCLPTQGNAGVAAALFSARMGLPGCCVYMPDGYQDGYYHRSAALLGAEVRFAGRNIAEAGRAMRDALREPLAAGAWIDLSTFFEPGRLEGKKTLGLEIVEQLGAERLPDWIVYPTGGGTGLVGIRKALAELTALGRLDPARPLPRLAAVQSEGCAPVVRAFEVGARDVAPVESHGTRARGLDVPAAIMGHGILRALRETRGCAVAVPEEAIEAAFRDLGRDGVAAGYEGAATLAGLRALRGRGEVPDGSRVLLLNTSGPAADLSAP